MCWPCGLILEARWIGDTQFASQVFYKGSIIPPPFLPPAQLPTGASISSPCRRNLGRSSRLPALRACHRELFWWSQVNHTTTSGCSSLLQETHNQLGCLTGQEERKEEEKSGRSGLQTEGEGGRRTFGTFRMKAALCMLSFSSSSANVWSK